jgi:hypothetical protein
MFSIVVMETVDSSLWSRIKVLGMNSGQHQMQIFTEPRCIYFPTLPLCNGGRVVRIVSLALTAASNSQ